MARSLLPSLWPLNTVWYDWQPSKHPNNFLIQDSLNISVCVCVHLFMCANLYVCVFVETRGQPRLLVPRVLPTLFSKTLCCWLGTCWMGWGGWLVSPRILCLRPLSQYWDYNTPHYTWFILRSTHCNKYFIKWAVILALPPMFDPSSSMSLINFLTQALGLSNLCLSSTPL